MTKRSNSPLFGNSDATPRPYQVSNDWVFNICEALSRIHKNVKIRKFFASPEKIVKCSYNSFALTPRCDIITKISRTGLKVIKLFSGSFQLTMKFILLINGRMPTIVGTLTFISRINTTFEG